MFNEEGQGNGEKPGGRHQIFFNISPLVRTHTHTHHFWINSTQPISGTLYDWLLNVPGPGPYSLHPTLTPRHLYVLSEISGHPYGTLPVERCLLCPQVKMLIRLMWRIKKVLFKYNSIGVIINRLVGLNKHLEGCVRQNSTGLRFKMNVGNQDVMTQ